MKLQNWVLLGAATLAAILLGGCNSFQTRAREKSETYQSLAPATRQRLEHGKIGVGDSRDMVYIALGYPDEVREISTSQGKQTLWIYRTYWQQFEGTKWVGWHRTIVPLHDGRGFAIIHEPVATDVYSTHIDEVIQVTFDHEMVTSVQQRHH